MSEKSNVLHHFVQFKIVASEAVQKCQNINIEEKSGQTIFLDKCNSRDFSDIMNATNTLKTSSCMKIKENENLKNNLSILIEKNKISNKILEKKLAAFNSRLINMK